MRRILFFAALLMTVAPAAAAGPKFSATGGVGAADSAYVGGEPSGGAYAITGTGIATFANIGPSQFRLADVGAVSRSINDASLDTTLVTAFCRRSNLDGSTDNTTCIQSAVNAICARAPAGGRLYFPEGRYAVSAATGITIGCQGVMVVGAGWGDFGNGQGSTVINVIGSGSAAIFKFQSTTKRVPGRYASGGGIQDIVINIGNAKDSPSRTGPAIDFEQCEGCIAQHFRIWAPVIGVRNYGGIMNRVSEFQINQIVAGGVGIINLGSDAGCSSDIGNCAGRSDLFRIDQGIIDAQFMTTASQPDCLVLQDFAATMWIGHVACNQTRTGLRVSCPNSATMDACPLFITIFDLENEAQDRGIGDGANIIITDAAHVVCTGCQLFGYAVTNNIAVANSRFNATGDIQFIGGKVTQARQSCIVSSASNTYFGGGMTVWGCGSAASGYYGVELRVPGKVGALGGGQQVKDINFCTVENNTVPSAMGAVSLASGLDYNIVSGNIMRGCASGVTDGSGGSHNSITGNVG